MPLYDYLCDHCGHRAENVYEKMAGPVQGDANSSCPLCADGRVDDGSWHRTPTSVHTDMKEFHTPIDMYSIALNTDDEIKDFMKRAPGVEVETDPDHEMYGIPIARSRKQKLTALKAMSYVERN